MKMRILMNIKIIWMKCKLRNKDYNLFFQMDNN